MSIPQTQSSFISPPPPAAPGMDPAVRVVASANNQTAPAAQQEEERIKQYYETVVKQKAITPEKDKSEDNNQEKRQSQKGENNKAKKRHQAGANKEASPGQAISTTASTKLPPGSSDVHTHICAGCGKTRSKGYHMTHPLKNGERPEPDYCRRCIVTAEFTDSEATESIVGIETLMVS